jgi:ATP-binding cassette subfamily B protein
MKKINNLLQHKYALSKQGTTDMIKAFISCTLSYIVLMFPVGLLYFMVGDLLSSGIGKEKAITYIIGSILCLLLIAITTYRQYNATFFATYIESGIRRLSLAERLRKLPLSFFGKKDLADLTSTIMADCATIETASSHYIPELVGSLISATLIGISLFFFDWRLAIAALWVLPVSFVIVIASRRVQNHFSRKQMKDKMNLADGIQECLETVRDLKSNNAEWSYMEGLDHKVETVERSSFVSEIGTGVFVVSAQMILKLGMGTVALTGASLLITGSINVITFFCFLLVISRLYDPLQSSLINLAAIIGANIPSERMNEILEHPIQTGNEKLTNKGYDITFDHVGFAYDTSRTVLKDVSFTACQGEVTALIGPSGGGKTTAIRLATRFWDVPKGNIYVGGMDISKIDPETLMSLYSIVFQNVTLFNNTVMENIRIGRKGATDEEVKAAAHMAHVDEFANKLPDKWNTMIGENGCELSGGERQRISIARAFLKDAPIILLDEATASLDVENETMVQESLSHLIKDKTVMIIAHRMRTVGAADKIVVLKDGLVNQQGCPSELLNKGGQYRDMVEKQQLSQKWKL